ncbi:ABC transporter ATP-binding protein [Legionella saoudiensis]|uniref:ABC transporter ATP-binding protein n=1 Tax=Legionella saoudiensis TaxID=1750561 RepID=UPI000731197C|nr:ABC transporter ATP-binding protein [Legionella saoudiensis]
MERNIKLQKIYKSFANKVLFADLSYTFHQQVYHIIGKNGAGKSTLLRLIVGLDTPDSGCIVLNDNHVVRENSVNAKKLFYVPDDLAIYPFLTGSEFLLWLAKARTNNSAEINSLLEQFELEQHAHTKIADMSFGTKKKFLLSSALIGQPDFIILDEPLNGLDKNAQQVLLAILAEKAAHCGILLTTHHDAHLERLNPVKVEVQRQRLELESLV